MWTSRPQRSVGRCRVPPDNGVQGRGVTASRYQRPRHALWHRTSVRLVVSPDAEAATVDLRDIPALVWEALAEPLTLDELVEDLAAVFDRSGPAIRAEVEALLDDMAMAGLVEKV